MGTRSAYSNEEWVEIVNGAAKYLRAVKEEDGTFIGSLKDAMANFIAHIPGAKIEGSSLAAVLPLTGIVSNGGRSNGHTIWSISSNDITVDDWIRMTYLRRNNKAESKQKKPNRRAPAVPQRATIDETLTGHPEVVVSPEIDYKEKLEAARVRIEGLLEENEALTANNRLLVEGARMTTEDLAEINRLRGLLRDIASNPVAYEAFRAGLEMGGGMEE